MGHDFSLTRRETTDGYTEKKMFSDTFFDIEDEDMLFPPFLTLMGDKLSFYNKAD